VRFCEHDVRLLGEDRELDLCLLCRALRLTANPLDLGPAPTELSLRIAKGPISAVERTCVPPQSSIDQPPMSTMRTISPYFSPKSIIAPSRRASSIVVS
jgi:hypothetical protein